MESTGSLEDNVMRRMNRFPAHGNPSAWALAWLLICTAILASDGICGVTLQPFQEGHELVIDGFNAPLSRLEAVDSGGVFPVKVGATTKGSMIGGEFGVQLQLLGVHTPGAGIRLAIGNGVFQYHQDAGATGSVVWHYDGNDADPATIHASTGLGGIDLTRGGGLDRLAVKVVSNTAPMALSFVLFSDANNASEATKTIPPTNQPGTIWFPFSEFTASNGSGANPASIRAIAAVLGSAGSSGQADIGFSCITATPNPAAPKVLYDQLGHKVGTTIYSLNFPGTNPYDAQAADDFNVPQGRTWRIGGFRFGAVYSPQPPANPTADLTVFTDNAGAPGPELFSETGVAINRTNIPETWDAFLKQARELPEGRYWASIQGNVPIGTEMRVNESNEPAGVPYHFRNPGGALAPGCTDWQIGTHCLGQQPSLAFSVLWPIPIGGGKANDDHYKCFGNTGISVPSPSGLLANDVLGAGQVIPIDITLPSGGTLHVAPDGAFTYSPKYGFRGDDTFNYTLEGGSANGSQATVRICVAQAVWHINNDPKITASSANLGTLTDPFVNLDTYNASSMPRAGDIAFLYSGTYTGSLKLLDNQIVASKVDTFLTQPSSGRWGDYASLNLPPAFKFPQTPAMIQSLSGDTITTGKDNMLIGVTIGTAPGGYAIKGQDFGKLTLLGVTVSGLGAGVDLQNGRLDAEYTNIFSFSGTGPALRWSFGLAPSDANGSSPWEQRSCGPQLNLTRCTIFGSNGGVDARVFGSASAAVVATDNVIEGGSGWGVALTAQDTSTLWATLTGNTAAGALAAFRLTQANNSIFKLPGFTGGDADAVTTFIRNNNIGTPSVSVTGNIGF